jgi:hypothetical protein
MYKLYKSQELFSIDEVGQNTNNAGKFLSAPPPQFSPQCYLKF